VGAIIPAAVGVDLGCGMMAVRTPFVAAQLPDSLSGLRSAIERGVPHGRTANGGPGDRGAFHQIPERVESAWAPLAEGYAEIVSKHPRLGRNQHPTHHLGTLGTGNHFIEVCLDKSVGVWVMLHSGSRGVGNRIGSYFIEKAKEDMRRWFINLPDEDLAYLPEGSDSFRDYVRAVVWAQEYARINREVMMREALRQLYRACGQESSGEAATNWQWGAEAVNCHHNYVAKEWHFGKNVWVTRKGAVDASAGKLGIIPGSMGVRSFIVRGKGNRESFNSCSHGAGRRMSRTQARKEFTLEEHAKATEGVECRKDSGVLDETPAAYKDIDAVMAAQADLVDVVHTLKQVLCVKG
jgi:tRNA-splicing ligase RtcB